MPSSARRLDAAMLAEIMPRLGTLPKHVFVCGSNPFVEAASEAAIAAAVRRAAVADRVLPARWPRRPGGRVG